MTDQQRYRHLRRILIASLFVTGFVLLMAQTAPPPSKAPAILQASAFHLLGADGTVRARLGLSIDGQPARSGPRSPSRTAESRR
jgi:hypothetical protein